MPYLFYVSHQYATKNKLEKATLEFLNKQDRKLLNSEIEAIKFRDDVLTWINGLNAAHPKCKPITPHWYRSPTGNKKDIYLHESRVVHAVLLETKMPD